MAPQTIRGMYWRDRSLLDNRDSLYLSPVFSEDTEFFASSYTAPINHYGSRAGLSYLLLLYVKKTSFYDRLAAKAFSFDMI